jgi:glycosyltransferase involved in cell wall biosynthesis
MRIGVLYPVREPLSPANWSGMPHGLADGLGAHGAEVVPVGAALPIGVHEAVAVLSRMGGQRGAVADRTLIRQAARNWALSRAIAAAGPIDALLAMGTEMYDLAAIRPAGVPVATYDDGTLLQMWRNPDSDIRLSGFPINVVRRWFRRQEASSRAASRCCVTTAWAACSFIEDYHVEPDRVCVVGMGHRPRDDAAQRRNWCVPRFLFVGVDWQRKNGDAVLKAFAAVSRDHPGATLDVVGRHPRLDLPRVTGHGFLPREDASAQRLLDRLFAQATAFVLPSRFDPSPIAYLEAASAGLPVIATSRGGASELLGDAAITVNPDDPAALVKAMHRLADPAIAQSMGAEASRAATTSTWSAVAGRVLAAMLPQTTTA